MQTTAMQDLLEYIKNTRALTFLPDQLTEIIEDKFLPKSRRDIRDAFNNGEANVWNRYRDENFFEFESGDDYYNKTYKKQ